MQVLIVDDDIDRQSDLTIAFMQAGFQAMATHSLRVAETCIRRNVVDLLVMTERVQGRLTHALALLGEYRNPMLATILLTDRTDSDVDELFLLLPSLHGLLSPDSDPAVVTKLLLGSLTSSADGDRPMVLTASMRVGDTAAIPIFASRRQAPAPLPAALEVA